MNSSNTRNIISSKFNMNIIKKGVLSLSEYDKRRLRTFEGVKSNKQLIEKLKGEGKNLFKNPETQLKKALEITLNKFNKEAKKEKAYKNFDKKVSKDIKGDKEVLKYVKLDNRKKEILSNRLLETDNRYLINVGRSVLTINSDILNALLGEEEVQGDGSDAQIIKYVKDNNSLTLELVNKKERHLNGSFFKYEHNIAGLDLEDLQIYEDFNPSQYKENCFIKSLMGEVPDNILNDLRLMAKGKDITVKCISEIAEKYNITIKIKLDDKHNRTYGTNKNTIINICLIEGHFFKLKTVSVTAYAIEHYKDISHLDRWYQIYKIRDGKYKRDSKRYIDSYNVVKLLLANKEKYLRPIEKSILLDSTAYFSTIKDITNLNYDETKNLKLNEYKEKTNKFEYINIFFDFETYTDGDKHEPYLCCVKSGEYKKTFTGNECGRIMLDTLHKDFKAQPLKLIAHNISYDLKFIFKYLSQPSFVKRGSMVMFGDAKYWNNNKPQILKFQDSYALISSKLNAFGSMFGFSQEKEFIPYNLYKSSTEELIHIDEAILKISCKIQVEQNNIGKSITNEMVENFYNKFITNAKKWNCINNKNQLNIYKYSEVYCEIDCEILEKGYNTFRDQIKEAFDMKLDNYVSAAAFSNDVLILKGAYEGVYMLNGVVREFIQLCMVGGRTMCANNNKDMVEGERLSDFDAVSLYPSAMERLGGYLLGKPKILSTCNYDIIKNYDGYFVEVEIMKVNKNLSFPLLSYIDENGVRNFTNQMEGRTVYLDKVSLEDAIKFQEIQFRIIKGYYYDEGRNYKLQDIIKHLFHERLRLKKEKNPLQNIYKLIMNSAYGKTLLKPIDENITYIKGQDKMKAYLINNYTFHKETTLMSEEDIQDNLKVYQVKTIKPIHNHFNNAACGVEVLSMSKRIMNEVMCLAEEEKLKIYYQDTDSMHINEDNITKLSNSYRKIYNRELIGKGMGQFHTDFSSKILDEESIYARRSIFLGKKCYIDELSDKDGKIDYHIRMKGISEDSVKYHSYLDFNNDPYALFEYLYNGNKYTFDLTCNKMKCCFESVNMNTIRSREDFNREIKF